MQQEPEPSPEPEAESPAQEDSPAAEEEDQAPEGDEQESPPEEVQEDAGPENKSVMNFFKTLVRGGAAATAGVCPVSRSLFLTQNNIKDNSGNFILVRLQK